MTYDLHTQEFLNNRLSLIENNNIYNLICFRAASFFKGIEDSLIQDFESSTAVYIYSILMNLGDFGFCTRISRSANKRSYYVNGLVDICNDLILCPPLPTDSLNCIEYKEDYAPTYKTWLAMYALKKNLWSKINDKLYVWNNLNFSDVVYLDLFSPSFLCYFNKLTR